MLNKNYDTWNNTKKIKFLREEVFRAILVDVFTRKYGKSWWKEVILPYMRNAICFDETEAGQYETFLDRKNNNYIDMDVTMMSSILLFNYSELLNGKVEECLHELRKDRNDESHSIVEDDKRERKRLEISLSNIKKTIATYGKNKFDADLVNAVEKFDFTQEEKAKLAEIKRIQEEQYLKDNLGQFYNQYKTAVQNYENKNNAAKAVDALYSLAQIGLTPAVSKVLEILLRDADFFDMHRAAKMLESLPNANRSELAQLAYIKNIIEKEKLAEAGDMKACEELADMFADPEFTFHIKGGELRYYILAAKNGSATALAKVEKKAANNKKAMDFVVTHYGLDKLTANEKSITKENLKNLKHVALLGNLEMEKLHNKLVSVVIREKNSNLYDYVKELIFSGDKAVFEILRGTQDPMWIQTLVDYLGNHKGNCLKNFAVFMGHSTCKKEDIIRYLFKLKSVYNVDVNVATDKLLAHILKDINFVTDRKHNIKQCLFYKDKLADKYRLYEEAYYTLGLNISSHAVRWALAGCYDAVEFLIKTKDNISVMTVLNHIHTYHDYYTNSNVWHLNPRKYIDFCEKLKELLNVIVIDYYKEKADSIIMEMNNAEDIIYLYNALQGKVSINRVNERLQQLLDVNKSDSLTEYISKYKTIYGFNTAAFNIDRVKIELPKAIVRFSAVKKSGTFIRFVKNTVATYGEWIETFDFDMFCSNLKELKFDKYEEVAHVNQGLTLLENFYKNNSKYYSKQDFVKTVEIVIDMFIPDNCSTISKKTGKILDGIFNIYRRYPDIRLSDKIITAIFDPKVEKHTIEYYKNNLDAYHKETLYDIAENTKNLSELLESYLVLENSKRYLIMQKKREAKGLAKLDMLTKFDCFLRGIK